MILAVLIQPNSKENEILGLHDGALKIRIKAPPIEGRANEELISFLSKVLGIPKRDFNVKSGKTGKRKLVHISSLDEIQLREILAAFLK